MFVSAGVEMVTRFAKGSSDGLPDTKNPEFAGAETRTEARAGGGLDTWHDPREDGELPDVYIAMGQTAENVAESRGISRAEQDEFGVRSQNLAEKAIGNGFWERDITPVTLPDGTRRPRDDGPRAGHHAGEGRRAQAGLPARRHGHRGQLLPAQRRRRRGGRDERHQGRRARPHAARPHRLHRASRPCPPRSWGSGRSRRPGRR